MDACVSMCREGRQRGQDECGRVEPHSSKYVLGGREMIKSDTERGREGDEHPHAERQKVTYLCRLDVCNRDKDPQFGTA